MWGQGSPSQDGPLGILIILNKRYFRDNLYKKDTQTLLCPLKARNKSPT